MVSEDAIMRKILNNKAIIEGHFFYTYNFHSQFFIDTNILFQSPDFVEEIADSLNEKLQVDEIDCVITPNFQGGLVLSHNIAEKYNANVILINRIGGNIKFSPELNIEGDIVIIDDGINTGNSLKQILNSLARNPKISIKGVGIFINRYPRDIYKDFHGMVKSVVTLTQAPFNLIDINEGNCHLCTRYTELKMGSRSSEINDKLSKELNQLELRPIYLD